MVFFYCLFILPTPCGTAKAYTLHSNGSLTYNDADEWGSPSTQCSRQIAQLVGLVSLPRRNASGWSTNRKSSLAPLCDSS